MSKLSSTNCQLCRETINTCFWSMCMRQPFMIQDETGWSRTHGSDNLLCRERSRVPFPLFSASVVSPIPSNISSTNPLPYLPPLLPLKPSHYSHLSVFKHSLQFSCPCISNSTVSFNQPFTLGVGKLRSPGQIWQGPYLFKSLIKNLNKVLFKNRHTHSSADWLWGVLCHNGRVD